MIARPIGSLAGPIAAGILPAAEFQSAKPRSGQKVWRNSYTEGQLEDRLWRPIGVGRMRGTVRGGKRLAGAILKAAQTLELRTRKERQQKRPKSRNGALGDIAIEVLKVMYDTVDFASGRLEPAIATIAEKIGKSYSAVHDALDRLRAFGFLKWIRRSRPTENKGEAGPQVEQIPSAYALTIPFEFEDFVQRLCGDGPPAECERWRREDADKQLLEMIAQISASRFHRDFWSGDKLTGESFASIAAALDRQERDSLRTGESRGSF